VSGAGPLAAGRRPEGGAAPGLRFAARLPEPAHFWIRSAPRAWEGPALPWLDLATGRLGRSGRRSADRAAGFAEAMAATLTAPESEAERPPPPPPLLDDLLYLPPVAAPLAAARDALAERALAGGTPVLVQLLPGDRAEGAAAAGAVLVVDLLAALLSGDLGGLQAIPERAAAAVWPLLPGIADDPALWERGCELLAAAGLPRVQALAPALGPGDRRRLAEASGGVAFEALFHRQPPAERDFARVAHRHGLAPFLPRPLPRPPQRRAGNRRVAGALALAAELWLRVGRPVEQAQSLFRAARWLDATAYELEALAREGNLAVVTALDPLARRAAAEALAEGEPALLAELMAEYLGDASGR
jgi:hypothetical protein